MLSALAFQEEQLKVPEYAAKQLELYPSMNCNIQRYEAMCWIQDKLDAYQRSAKNLTNTSHRFHNYPLSNEYFGTSTGNIASPNYALFEGYIKARYPNEVDKEYTNFVPTIDRYV
jgi:hypothetical protein